VNCQAKRADGSPCPHPATHVHATALGPIVNVCGAHRRVLVRRERSGSAEAKLRAWGVETPIPVDG
jgi:hypothetical protein